MIDLTTETYLILSRKLSERILIGDNMLIKVLDIHPHRVILGIHAPKDVAIWREELWLRQQQGLGGFTLKIV